MQQVGSMGTLFSDDSDGYLSGSYEIPCVQQIRALSTRAEACSLLNMLGHRIRKLDKLEEMKEFLLLLYHPDKYRYSSVAMHTEYETHFENYRNLQTSILELEQNINLFFCSDVIQNEELFRTIDRQFRRVTERLSIMIEEISKIDCPILVAGESNSGKTRLIHLLLGLDLPKASTRIICTYRYGVNKLVVFKQSRDFKKNRSGKHIKNDRIFRLDCPTEAEKKMIKEYLSSDDSYHQIYDEAEFFWPSSFLKDNAYIVDSPGIQTPSAEVYQVEPRRHRITLDFLKNKSVAFIFVFDATKLKDKNPGVENLLQSAYQKMQAMSNGSTNYPYILQNVLFIFNNWNNVTERGASTEEEYKAIAEATIKRLWPGIIPTDFCIYFSIDKMSDMMKGGVSAPMQCRAIKAHLRDLVLNTLDSVIACHITYLWDLMETCESAVWNKLKDKVAEEFDFKRRKQRTQEQLNTLSIAELSVGTIASDIMNEMELRFLNTCVELTRHLRQASTIAALETRLRATIQALEEPNPERVSAGRTRIQDKFTSLDSVTQFIAQELRSGIEKEIVDWNNSTKTLDNLTLTFNKLFQLKLVNYDDPLTPLVSRDIMTLVRDEANRLWDNESVSGFGTYAKRCIIGVCGTIMSPFLIIGGLVAAPFIISLLICQQLDKKETLQTFKDNPEDYILTRFRTYLTNLTHEIVQKMFLDNYRKQFSDCAMQLEQFIKRTLVSKRKELQDVMEDSRKADVVLNIYRPIVLDIDQCLGELHIIKLNFDQDCDQSAPSNYINSPENELNRGVPNRKLSFSNYPATYVLEEQPELIPLSNKSGTFASIYKTTKNSDYLLRVVNEPLTKLNARKYLNEINILRITKMHPNFVSWIHYFLVTTETYVRRLVHVIEMCDSNLRDFISLHPRLVPVWTSNREEYEIALLFCIDQICQLAYALHHLHHKTPTLVCTDLHLESILVKVTETRVIPKICDISTESFALRRQTVNPKSLFYTPPEMYAEPTNTAAASWESPLSNSFNLGIVAFELFAGVNPQIFIVSTLDSIIASELMTNVWPMEWRQMVIQCVDKTPAKRPTMLQILDVMATIFNRVFYPLRFYDN